MLQMVVNRLVQAIQCEWVQVRGRTRVVRLIWRCLIGDRSGWWWNFLNGRRLYCGLIGSEIVQTVQISHGGRYGRRRAKRRIVEQRCRGQTGGGQRVRQRIGRCVHHGRAQQARVIVHHAVQRTVQRTRQETASCQWAAWSVPSQRQTRALFRF